MKQIKILCTAVVAVLTLTASAQTNQVQNLIGTPSWADKTAQFLGAPSGSTLDVAAGGSYIPSFPSKQKWGYWVAATFATAPDSLFAYEFGTQYIQTTPKKGMEFQPNGLLLFRRTWMVDSIAITPLAEIGGAVDSHFSTFYGVTGAGLDVGWHGLSVVIGVERWTSAHNAFTMPKAGLAYSFTF